MLQASCIYLGRITPCPEIYHHLHPPIRLITPCPTTNVISKKEYSKYPSWLTVSLIASTNLPISMKPPCSLSALSLVVRLTVAPPCLNKGNLLLLRSSFLFCLGRTMPYRNLFHRMTIIQLHHIYPQRYLSITLLLPTLLLAIIISSLDYFNDLFIHFSIQ